MNFSALERLLKDVDRQSDQTPANGPPQPPKFKMLTLKEASFLSQEREDALLHEGELGTLTFFVRVPAGATIHLYNERTAETAEPPLMRIPHLLFLDSSACTELITWKRAEIGRASLGASLLTTTHGDQLRLKKPADYGTSAPQAEDDTRFVLRKWTHWNITLANGAPLEVEMDAVRVFEAAIEHRFELNLEPRVDFNSAAVSGGQENYKSDLLQYANQAAHLHWGRNVKEDDTSTYPDTDEIVKWLRIRHEGLTESLARSIASIIRPDFAPSTRVSKEPKELRDPPRKRKKL